jgi:hypothetical protein
VDDVRRRLVRLLGAGAVAASLIGVPGVAAAHQRTQAEHVLGAAAFTWLKPRPAPGTWKRETNPSGAALTYPPAFTPMEGDPGTESAAIRTPDGRYLAYLNVTPRQGTESLAGFSTYRVLHLREDHEARIRTLAVDERLSFTGGRGSCVIDDYVTSVHSNHYREIACLVVGRNHADVVVAAATSAAWNRYQPLLRHTVESFSVS